MSIAPAWCVGVVALAVSASTACDLSGEGVGVADPSDKPYVADDDYPPEAFVATLEPEYYDGRSVYWWHGGWRYRDHGQWATYWAEPAALRQARARDVASGAAAAHKTTTHGGGRIASNSAPSGRQ